MRTCMCARLFTLPQSACHPGVLRMSKPCAQAIVCSCLSSKCCYLTGQQRTCDVARQGRSCRLDLQERPARVCPGVCSAASPASSNRGTQGRGRPAAQQRGQQQGCDQSLLAALPHVPGAGCAGSQGARCAQQHALTSAPVLSRAMHACCLSGLSAGLALLPLCCACHFTDRNDCPCTLSWALLMVLLNLLGSLCSWMASLQSLQS